MNVVAVDPGINGCGVAVFECNRRLVEAAYVRNPIKAGSITDRAASMGLAVTQLIIDLGYWGAEFALEWPRVYASRIREGRTREDPNDLLALAGVQSVIASRGVAALSTCYAPSDWKPSGMKKKPTEFRVRSRLNEIEGLVLAAVKCPPSLMHNVIDAVGIGLHHVGRSIR